MQELKPDLQQQQQQHHQQQQRRHLASSQVVTSLPNPSMIITHQQSNNNQQRLTNANGRHHPAMSLTGAQSHVRATTASLQGNSMPPECAGCQKPIQERYLLKALDQLWHEDCLKCACCDCRLGEVGSTLFTKTNLILCKRDYLRLFGTTGLCSACNKTIPAFEMVMRARGNVYHLECFACQQCNHRFCVGDKFYLHENKILCEYDYEERLVFASLPYNYNSLAQIKRQTQDLEAIANGVKDDGSSGYGSGDSPFDGR